MNTLELRQFDIKLSLRNIDGLRFSRGCDVTLPPELPFDYSDASEHA